MKDIAFGCIPELSVRTINILKNNGLDPWDDALNNAATLTAIGAKRNQGYGKFSVCP